MSSSLGTSVGSIAAFAILLGAAYYGVLIYVVWKFYQMFSRINDNIAAIHGSIQNMTALAPNASGPAPQTNIQVCPNCGLRVMPTIQGQCPSCRFQIQ